MIENVPRACCLFRWVVSLGFVGTRCAPSCIISWSAGAMPSKHTTGRSAESRILRDKVMAIKQTRRIDANNDNNDGRQQQQHQQNHPYKQLPYMHSTPYDHVPAVSNTARRCRPDMEVANARDRTRGYHQRNVIRRCQTGHSTS